MASFTAEPQATAGPPNRSSPPNRTPRPTPPAPEQSVPSNQCQALHAIGARHYRGISRPFRWPRLPPSRRRRPAHQTGSVPPNRTPRPTPPAPPASRGNRQSVPGTTKQSVPGTIGVSRLHAIGARHYRGIPRPSRWPRLPPSRRRRPAHQTGSVPPDRIPRPTPPAPEQSVPSNRCQALPTINRCQALPGYSASIPMASFTAEPQATAGLPNRSSPPNRTPRPTPPAPEQSVPSNR